MTRLRMAFFFVAVVAGDYAILTLIDGQLIDFGITATICAGSSAAAGLIAYADRRRRKAVRVDERPSGSAVTRRPPQTNSARYAEAQAKSQVIHPDSLIGSARAYAGNARRHSTPSRHDESAAGLGRHERARHRIGFTASRSKSTGGTKSSTVPVPCRRRR